MRVKNWYNMAVKAYLPVNKYDVKYKVVTGWREISRPRYNSYCRNEIEKVRRKIKNHKSIMQEVFFNNIIEL